MLACLFGRHLIVAKAFQSFITCLTRCRFAMNYPARVLLITVCLLDHRIMAGSISVRVKVCPHSGHFTAQRGIWAAYFPSGGMLQGPKARLNSFQR
jgi:hypothetical protein